MLKLKNKFDSRAPTQQTTRVSLRTPTHQNWPKAPKKPHKKLPVIPPPGHVSHYPRSRPPAARPSAVSTIPPLPPRPATRQLARHPISSPPFPRRRGRPVAHPDGRLSPPRRHRFARELHPRGRRRLSPPRVRPVPTPGALLVLVQSPPRGFAPGGLARSPFRGEGSTPGPPRRRRPSGGANRESTLSPRSLRLLPSPAARFSSSQACFFVCPQLILRSLSCFSLYTLPQSFREKMLIQVFHFTFLNVIRVDYLSYGGVVFDYWVPRDVLYTLLR